MFSGNSVNCSAMFKRLILYLFLFVPFSQSLLGQKTALLIIDVQEFYFPGGRMQLENPEAAGINAGLLMPSGKKAFLCSMSGTTLNRVEISIPM